jgi:hypothetical protein
MIIILIYLHLDCVIKAFSIYGIFPVSAILGPALETFETFPKNRVMAYQRYSRWLSDGNGNPKVYTNRKTYHNHKQKMLAMVPAAAVLFPHIDTNGTDAVAHRVNKYTCHNYMRQYFPEIILYLTTTIYILSFNIEKKILWIIPV